MGLLGVFMEGLGVMGFLVGEGKFNHGLSRTRTDFLFGEWGYIEGVTKIKGSLTGSI